MDVLVDLEDVVGAVLRLDARESVVVVAVGCADALLALVHAPWVASCTVTVDAEDVETCSGPEAGDALSHASFGEHGTREFFIHVRFHKHDEDRIVVHLLVELYARSGEEATEVLEAAARGPLAITSLAEESRSPASTGGDQH